MLDASIDDRTIQDKLIERAVRMFSPDNGKEEQKQVKKTKL